MNPIPIPNSQVWKFHSQIFPSFKFHSHVFPCSKFCSPNILQIRAFHNLFVPPLHGAPMKTHTPSSSILYSQDTNTHNGIREYCPIKQEATIYLKKFQNRFFKILKFFGYDLLSCIFMWSPLSSPIHIIGISLSRVKICKILSIIPFLLDKAVQTTLVHRKLDLHWHTFVFYIFSEGIIYIFA